MVAIMIMLSIESAIVGVEVCGFIESIISGKVKSNANMPSVNVNLLPILSGEFLKIKIAPRRKNIEMIGMTIIAIA
jgi:hypothetical protein